MGEVKTYRRKASQPIEVLYFDGSEADIFVAYQWLKEKGVKTIIRNDRGNTALFWETVSYEVGTGKEKMVECPVSDHKYITVYNGHPAIISASQLEDDYELVSPGVQNNNIQNYYIHN